MINIEHGIEKFKSRISEDGADFCKSLFEYATVRLMCHKYAYYVLQTHFVDDVAYDIEEKSWYIMGRALGLLEEDETSPCVDYDSKHPQAKAGEKLAKSLIPISKKLKAKKEDL